MRSLLLLGFCLIAVESWAFDQEHQKWTAVLQAYQNEEGLVNYAKLKQDAAAAEHLLSQYLEALAAVKKSEYQSWSRHEQMAFLINAYNAFTIQLIIDHYPVKSIRKIGGFFSGPWKKEFFSILDGELKSLDPIEHDVLRPEFKDYRIHAAVNCASISCPPLRNEAFTGARLDEQLDDQMRQWFADPGRNRFALESGEIELSRIFDWYEKDFDKWGGGIIIVLQRYAPDEVKELLKNDPDIDYLKYNWSLNEYR